ncbi:MAG: AAA domain-containing protein [Cyclobacteriaceae bacterium]|nr:AAA domain-containing protein [Cyclobacteriaceae bacterium]
MARRDIQEELKHTLALLMQEKEEDLLVYKRKMTGTSIHERRKQGVCWYPVTLEKTQFSSGERLLVKVMRPPEHHDSHLFQSGKLVSLFSNAGANHENSEVVNGVVNQVNEHVMIITLNVDDIPEWINDGLLGVQLLFDENAYREMENAMKALIKTKDDRINHLKGVLLGAIEAQSENLYGGRLPELNDSQNQALRMVRNAHDLAIVHGPPGTGKTTTLVQAIIEVLNDEKQVLVCAPSNAAVDLLAEKLDEKGVNVVRIGHPARVTEKILSLTLDARIAQHRNFKELRAVRKKAEEYRSLGKKYKRNFGQDEREQRRLLLAEATRMTEQAEQLEFYITNSILSNAQVIASTLVGSNSYSVKGMEFQTVFIDEAAQALEPACWIPIMKSQRVIFAGDHFQLPPTIKSYQAAKGGLETTLFEKAITRNKADIMLREQYRMHELIMNFSGEYFYKGRLIANEKVRQWLVFDGDEPLEFIDTAGTGFFEKTDQETKSSYNPEEVALLFRHFIRYLDLVNDVTQLNAIQNIGLISPYKAQVGLIQDFFEGNHKDHLLRERISINTIDAFQGQERDIIYISLVRSNEKGEIGFLADTRRMNVAMTRARKKLVIIGDSGTIGSNEFYSRFLDYVNRAGTYRSAFEFME